MRVYEFEKLLNNNFIFCLITVALVSLVIFTGLEINKVIFEPERCEKENIFPMVVGGLVILIMIAIRKGTLIKNRFMFLILSMVIASFINRIISIIIIWISGEKYAVGNNTVWFTVITVVVILMDRFRDKKLKNKQNEKERE